MKFIAALALTLTFVSNSFAAEGEFFCYEDDGSPIHVRISIPARAALMKTEPSTDKTFRVTAMNEQMLMVFGNTQECFIKFQPAPGGRSGRATYMCNADKYPNAPRIELMCSVVKDY